MDSVFEIALRDGLHVALHAPPRPEAYCDAWTTELCLRPSIWSPTAHVVLGATCGFCEQEGRALPGDVEELEHSPRRRVFCHPFHLGSIWTHLEAEHEAAWEELIRLNQLVASSRGSTRASATTRARNAFLREPAEPGTRAPSVRPARTPSIEKIRDREDAVDARERAVNKRAKDVSIRERAATTRENDVGMRERAVTKRERALDELEQHVQRVKRLRSQGPPVQSTQPHAASETKTEIVPDGGLAPLQSERERELVEYLHEDEAEPGRPPNA